MTDIRLTIAIPTAGVVPMPFAYSLATMLSYTAAKGVPTMPDANVEIDISIVESSNWIENREQLVESVVERDRTHIMFLDDDMSFEPQVLSILLGRRQPVVVTNYLIKTEPAKDFVAVSLDDKRVTTNESSTGLLPIAYSGFGVSIIETEVLKKVPRPMFLPKYNTETKKYTTEDLPFFEKVRELGYTVYLDQDASKLVTHHGRKPWNWKEVSHG